MVDSMNFTSGLVSTVDGLNAAIDARILASRRRRVRKDITLGTGGTATIDITPPTGQLAYAVAPDIDPIVTTNASGTITYVPRVTSVSTTSLTVSALRTKSALTLTAGPLEVAVAGDVISVWVLEK